MSHSPSVSDGITELQPHELDAVSGGNAWLLEIAKAYIAVAKEKIRFENLTATIPNTGGTVKAIQGNIR